MTTTADTLTATAAVLDSPDAAIDVRQLTLRGPQQGEVLVRLRSSGVCHSDLHARNGDWTTPFPVVLGHEGAGIIEAIASDVPGLAVGDHVALSWVAPCRNCARCARGQGWACATGNSFDFDAGNARQHDKGTATAQFLGLGTFADRVVVPHTAVTPIPREVPFEIAALIGCAVATGVGAVTNNAGLPAGASALIIGCGGVGLSTVMGARLSGASPIIAIDTDAAKLELARSLGATHTAQPSASVCDVVPDGVDFAFDAVGKPVTMNAAIEALAVGGTAIIVGMPAEGVTLDIDPLTLAVSGQTIVGSNFGGTVPQVDFPRLCALYLAGQLPIDTMIGERVTLSDVDRVLADLADGRVSGRTVITHT